MWRITEKSSITHEHLVKLQTYYNAQVIAYSIGSKSGSTIPTKDLINSTPLLSPILEEMSYPIEKAAKIVSELFQSAIKSFTK